jgi:hypothetical protein
VSGTGCAWDVQPPDQCPTGSHAVGDGCVWDNPDQQCPEGMHIEGDYCTGNTPTGTDWPDTTPPVTAAEAMSDFMSRLQASPFVQAFDGLGEGQGGCGVCPPIDLDLGIFGHHHTEIHCQIWQNSLPYIQAAMTAVWAALAMFIILGA